MIQRGSKVGIVCCSNGWKSTGKEQVEKLIETLKGMGLKPVCSSYIYEKKEGAAGTAKERAEILMRFYQDREMKAIFDISGGDLANEILPEIDFSILKENPKMFWGYSDLTTIINAIYTRTGNPSMLYQVRNLIYDFGEIQKKNFIQTVLDGQTNLLDIKCDFIQGNGMQGIVVGGNIRCFLKLAGTPYFPDVKDKILLLESYGGLVPQMITYLSQLKQMGIFEKVAGILLGTFTQLEKEEKQIQMEDLIQRFVDERIPIAKTKDIGHGTDAKAMIIGREMILGKLTTEKE